MIKSLFESLLIVLLPFFLIFAVYRFCLGYNPLNFKALISSISSQFDSSADYLGDFIRLQSVIMDESYALIEKVSSVINTGFAPLDNVVNFFVGVFTNIYVSLTHLGSLISVGFQFVFSLLGDFFGVILMFGEFLIDSSPYKIFPYFVPAS